MALACDRYHGNGYGGVHDDNGRYEHGITTSVHDHCQSSHAPKQHRSTFIGRTGSTTAEAETGAAGTGRAATSARTCTHHRHRQGQQSRTREGRGGTDGEAREAGEAHWDREGHGEEGEAQAGGQDSTEARGHRQGQRRRRKGEELTERERRTDTATATARRRAKKSREGKGGEAKQGKPGHEKQRKQQKQKPRDRKHKLKQPPPTLQAFALRWRATATTRGAPLASYAFKRRAGTAAAGGVGGMRVVVGPAGSPCSGARRAEVRASKGRTPPSRSSGDRVAAEAPTGAEPSGAGEARRQCGLGGLGPWFKGRLKGGSSAAR